MLAIVSFGSRIIDLSGSEYWELAPDKTVQVAGDISPVASAFRQRCYPHHP